MPANLHQRLALALPLWLALAGAGAAQTGPEPRAPLTALETLTQVSVAASAPTEEVRGLQERLAQWGYDPGPADGLMGPRTRRALLAWQRDQGLEPSGEPTPETTERLAEGGPAPPRDSPLTANERRLDEAARLRPYLLGMQAELREHGYFVGPATEHVTPHLRQAIRAYERDSGLEPSGEVSQALLDHLRFARPEIRAALP